MKIRKIVVALMMLMSLSFFTSNTSLAESDGDTRVSLSSTKKIIIYDKLLDTQYTCSSGTTLKREYREQKYILETYNSSGKLIKSQTIITNYFTPYTFVANGCRIPARSE